MKKVVWMEKYSVETIFDNKSQFIQNVMAKNKHGIEKIFCLRSILPVHKGDCVNVYEKKGIVNTTVAYSYKINDKRFVDLLRCADVKWFYDGIGFVDSCRLSRDIRQALRTNGVKPTLSRKNNLLLFYHIMER